MSLDEARAHFPVLERLAYLNAGSVGPLARETLEAVREAEDVELEEGRGALPQYLAGRAVRERVREALARELGVGADRVALTGSTTDGCNVVLTGLELEADDEIVTTDVEHFGLLGPLGASAATVRVACVRDLPAALALDAILAEVGPRTRLLALSHVAWSTGHVLPVRELKEQTGLPVLVDGAQSVGAVPVDVEPFDFYTVSAQKWLCGPEATGGLYIRDPEVLRIACPSYFAQARHEPDGRFEPAPGAGRFDRKLPTPLLVGLERALELAPEWRFERAAEMTARCHELLAERAEVVTEPAQATLVSFHPPGEAAETAAALLEQGVVVRDIPATGWLRASCGWWTSDEDLERLAGGLDKAGPRGVPRG